MRIQYTITNKDGQEEQIYKPDSYIKATTIPNDKCFWEFLVERMKGQLEVPAIELADINGVVLSRTDLIERARAWAKAFYAIGVQPGEIVPFFGLTPPDMAAAAGGLNLINAVPYFLRPNISGKAIKKESKHSRFAVVFGPMWKMTEKAFDNFQKVIVVSMHDWIPNPIKRNIVKFSTRKMLDDVPFNDICIMPVADFLKLGSPVDDILIDSISHSSNDMAMITSSSGTTNNDINKGIVATNGSIIANLLQTSNGEPEFHYGRRCLCRGPFAFSTIVNATFLFPLYMGQTVISYLNPDASKIVDDIIRIRPNVVMCTGAHWDFFFRKVQAMIDAGNIPNLSFIDKAIIGGSGTTPTKMLKWNPILKQCGCKFPIFCGYGLSEVFAVISVNTIRVQPEHFAENDVISVGFPMPGVTVAILLDDGTILENPDPAVRGELLISCRSMMQGYYDRREATDRAFLFNQNTKWLRTGDLAHLDSDGRIYIWGRCDHKLIFDDISIHASDITTRLCKHPNVEDAVVFTDGHSLFLHLDALGQAESVMLHVKSVLADLALQDKPITTHFYPNGFPLDELSTKTDYNGMKSKDDCSE